MLLFYALIATAEAPPTLITLYCPAAAAVRATAITGSSWANYNYSAEVSIDFAPLGNHLPLSGEGTAPQAILFQAATWTDRTFLCNYNQGPDAIVIFETRLAPYVEKCYFTEATFPAASECIKNDPSQCPMTCKLGSPDP